MKKELELVVNRWFAEWLMTNDSLEDDFEGELEALLPDYKFTWSIPQRQWLIL